MFLTSKLQPSPIYSQRVKYSNDCRVKNSVIYVSILGNGAQSSIFLSLSIFHHSKIQPVTTAKKEQVLYDSVLCRIQHMLQTSWNLQYNLSRISFQKTAASTVFNIDFLLLSKHSTSHFSCIETFWLKKLNLRSNQIF